MSRGSRSTSFGAPPQPALPGHPKTSTEGDKKSASSQRIRKQDKLLAFFRSSSSERRIKNAGSTSPKPTIKEDPAASTESSVRCFSNVSAPDSVAIDGAFARTAVKIPSFSVPPPTLSTKPRLGVFPHNANAPAVRIPLPKLGTRIDTTPQLAMCIGLLAKDCDTVDQQEDPSQDMSSDAAAQLAWVKVMSQDLVEKNRTLWLGTRMVDEFAADASKDLTKIAEMVLIGPVLDKENFRRLLSCIITAFDQSVILDVDLLQGLVQLVQSAPPESLVSDDLIKIFGLLRVRLQGTHQQSSVHPYHLTLAVSRLLDVMADHKVKDLNRVEEHEPLSRVLSGLEDSSDPYLMYQACYAFQALQYVPNDETMLQGVLRLSTGAVDGLVKVTAVMKLDLGAVLDGLCQLQEVLSSTIEVAGTVYKGVCSLMESGRGVLESLKEGYGKGKKRPWYPAVRAAYALAQAGQLQDLNRLIMEAPCRRDPLFQWGICQLLGEIAFDAMWDIVVRQQVVELLGDLLQNDPEWGQGESVKTWMLSIIGQLGAVADQAVSTSACALLRSLQYDQTATTIFPYPLRSRFPLPTSSPTLAKVQRILPLEYDLHQLQVLRLKQSHKRVYIPPMAKPSLKAKDDDLFLLMEKMQEFLASDRQVMLILGDSGAGKSTFNRHLEHCLWTEYKAGNPIPLFINLPAIDRPDQDLVAKQLRVHSLSEDQIMEIKLHRQIILICDGYDEIQQLVNLHRTNMLNQPGQWNTKVVISCRTQFLGPDYYNHFVPQGEGGHYDRPALNMFQEAVIAPFSEAQIENYVEQYVPLEPRTWSTKDYMDRLTTIPNLLDLAKNPFLLSLSLEALPGVTEGKQDLFTIKITRAQLYDTFVSHWLDVNKRRLQTNSALSMDDCVMLNQLVSEGFISLGFDYATRLARAIFDKQDGNPVVKYFPIRDKNTWKSEFFGPQTKARLLRESSPLTRTGNQFRFLHRSMLEYFFSRVIYNPVKVDDDYDIENHAESPDPPLLDADSPLFRRNLLHEPSIIQFLCDRIKSSPDFEQHLRAVIEQSKKDAGATTGATNAITILVRAGVSFNGADLRGIKIPGADLSEGQFDSAQLQGADLTGANLSRSWLRQADLSNAQLGNVQYEELPYLEMEKPVWSCAYSPDGTLLSAGLFKGDLVIYNTSTWTIVLWIKDVEDVRSVAFSPDSHQIVFGGDDCKVRVWNCASGEEVLVMEGHTRGVYSADFSPCGKRIASASEDETVRLWDAQTGKSRLVLKGHTSYVASVKFSPDGRQVVSGSWDGTIRWIASGHDKGILQLWSAVSGEPGLALRGHTHNVTAIAFSPNRQWIASSSEDETVRLWNSSTGAPLSILTGHKSEVRDIAFSPKGLQLASGGYDEKVRLWDLSASDRSVVIQEDRLDRAKKVMYSSGSLSVISVKGRSIRQYDPVTGAQGAFAFEIPEGIRIGAMSFSPDGSQIAVNDSHSSVRLWDYRTGTAVAALKGHKHSTIRSVYSPCGRWLVTVDWVTPALLWDLHDTRQEPHALAGIDEPSNSWASCAIFSTSGSQVAIGFLGCLVRLFSLPATDAVKSANFGTGYPVSLSYSPTCQELAIGTQDGSIYLWDVGQSEDKEVVDKLDGHQDVIRSISYSPCGQWIASGSDDRTVRLGHKQQQQAHEPPSWSCVSTIRGFYGCISEIVWNPLVPMEFVTQCEDQSIRIWKLSSDDGRTVVRMQWGTNLRLLYAEGLVLKDATGLSPMNQKLLVQRGAVDGSLVHGREGSDSEE
ncbi:hypothetical protein BG015_006591 [Linnemannia schmuckeri]|uniref:WD40 repeat-like protein n=1 Tax=Linnemannia schmuckeri TaxID=64567 RepID=A0A9P5S0A4_9FUNG|nr:hypothetical protein BG015_006591 [Linnemannia schmuckeri]